MEALVANQTERKPLKAPFPVFGGKSAIEGNENCKRERIWFSPHCLKPEKERMLFA